MLMLSSFNKHQFCAVLLDVATGDDNFYGGVSGSPPYDTMQNQQPAGAITAEEQAAREQVWQADLAKVSNVTLVSIEMCKCRPSCHI